MPFPTPFAGNTTLQHTNTPPQAGTLESRAGGADFLMALPFAANTELFGRVNWQFTRPSAETACVPLQLRSPILYMTGWILRLPPAKATWISIIQRQPRGWRDDGLVEWTQGVRMMPVLFGGGLFTATAPLLHSIVERETLNKTCVLCNLTTAINYRILILFVRQGPFLTIMACQYATKGKRAMTRACKLFKSHSAIVRFAPTGVGSRHWDWDSIFNPWVHAGMENYFQNYENGII